MADCQSDTPHVSIGVFALLTHELIDIVNSSMEKMGTGSAVHHFCIVWCGVMCSVGL
jgi:hypothetical protein